MVEIILNKGYYIVNNGAGKRFTVLFGDVQLPCARFSSIWESNAQTLPPIETVYSWAKGRGYDNDTILDRLIEMYFPIQLFKVNSFEDLAMCIGFIGHRGSGKTLSAVAVAVLDFMIRGFVLYSNVPVAFKVRYRDLEREYSSVPLDKFDLWAIGEEAGYRGGVALVDEINMETGDSSRFMSNANLSFTNVLQQMRKREMSVIWTAQSYNTIDPRIRFQTDFLVNCRDSHLSKQGGDYPGEKSRWTVYDLSGMTGEYDFEYELTHKFVTDFQVWTGKLEAEPWWGFYPTSRMQGQKNYIKVYNEGQKSNIQPLELPEAKNDPIKKLVDDMETAGINRVPCDELWQINNISGNKSKQVKVGQELHRRGFCKRMGAGGKYFYEINKPSSRNQ